MGKSIYMKWSKKRGNNLCFTFSRFLSDIFMTKMLQKASQILKKIKFLNRQLVFKRNFFHQIFYTVYFSQLRLHQVAQSKYFGLKQQNPPKWSIRYLISSRTIVFLFKSGFSRQWPIM